MSREHVTLKCSNGSSIHDLHVFILIGTFKSDVAHKVIKDEVNAQPHTMKGILCIILSVYIFMCIKGDVKEKILQCVFIVICSY